MSMRLKNIFFQHLLDDRSADVINLAVTQIHTKHVLIVINNATLVFVSQCLLRYERSLCQPPCLCSVSAQIFSPSFFMERDDQHVFPAVVQAFPNVEFSG